MPEFSSKTMKARRSWTDVIWEHKCQPRLLYPAKLSITIDGESKISHDTLSNLLCGYGIPRAFGVLLKHLDTGLLIIQSNGDCDSQRTATAENFKYLNISCNIHKFQVKELT